MLLYLFSRKWTEEIIAKNKIILKYRREFRTSAYTVGPLVGPREIFSLLEQYNRQNGTRQHKMSKVIEIYTSSATGMLKVKKDITSLKFLLEKKKVKFIGLFMFYIIKYNWLTPYRVRRC
jgi:hypothetical protein